MSFEVILILACYYLMGLLIFPKVLLYLHIHIVFQYNISTFTMAPVALSRWQKQIWIETGPARVRMRANFTEPSSTFMWNTPDIISKYNFFSFRSKVENDVLSLTFNISAKSSSNSTIWGCFFWICLSWGLPQIVEFGEDSAEILKVKDNTSFSSLLLNEKKLDFEMISGVFNLQ